GGEAAAAGRGGRTFPASRGRGRGRSMSWKRTAAAPVPPDRPAAGADSHVPGAASPSPVPGAAPRAGGNRVWVNAEAGGPSNGPSSATRQTTTALARGSAAQAVISTKSKTGNLNRVWTSSSTTAAQIAGTSNVATKKPVGRPPPPSTPTAVFRGGSSAAQPRRGPGHNLVWTKAIGRGETAGGPARSDSRGVAPASSA
ncbi:unnamed protein product, partial [Ectocarpus sp. 8 AP-2014]